MYDCYKLKYSYKVFIMAKVKITETILRDAHQSLLATRMSLSEIIPSLPLLDNVGYHSIECWGGATFDACLRFLDEDPWERLRVLRNGLKNSKLQMLFRGQNMLGYRHYADDVVKYFVQKSIAHGIDIIRIFDALNDIRNLQTAISAAKIEKNAHVQVAISYTTGEVFTDEYYVNYAKHIESAGADSICIKDMASLLTPSRTSQLIKSLKESVSIPIQLHTHSTSGMAPICLFEGVKAGAEIIDTALSPLSSGASHPSTEAMVAAFKNTEYDTGISLEAFSQLREYFMTLRKKYIENGLLDPKLLVPDTKALIYQVPGGMLSNLLSQLKQANKEEQLDEVLQEVPRVRKDAGFPPLVTPTSQIVGTQAVLNVISGERYKMVTKEFKGLVRGEYGRTPVKISEEFFKKILGDQQPVDCRPADLLSPELESLRKEASEWIEQEEDVLSYAQFGQTAIKFFEKRRNRLYGIDQDHVDFENGVHPV